MAAGDTQLSENLFLIPGADGFCRSIANVRIAVFEKEDEQFQQLSGGDGGHSPGDQHSCLLWSRPGQQRLFQIPLIHSLACGLVEIVL